MCRCCLKKEVVFVCPLCQFQGRTTASLSRAVAEVRACGTVVELVPCFTLLTLGLKGGFESLFVLFFCFCFCYSVCFVLYFIVVLCKIRPERGVVKGLESKKRWLVPVPSCRKVCVSV